MLIVSPPNFYMRQVFYYFNRLKRVLLFNQGVQLIIALLVFLSSNLLLSLLAESQIFLHYNAKRGGYNSLPAAFTSVAGVLVSDHLIPQAVSDHEELAKLEQRIEKVLQQVIPATVAVDNGSGVLIRSDGLILTAAHVLVRSQGLAQVILPDGRRRQADILGVDLNSDTAIVKLIGRGPWPTVPLSRSNPKDNLNDTWCLATGYPSAFTRGKPAVARLGRIQNQHAQLMNTDCTLMGGDSGGPLVNLEGELIAIHTAIRSELSQNYHRPISQVRDAWEISDDPQKSIRKRMTNGQQLNAGSQPAENQSDLSRGQLETFKLPSETKVSIGLNAETDGQRVRVRKIAGASPAFQAGLQTEDVILKLGDQPIQSFHQFQLSLLEHRGRPSVDLIVNRYGRLIRLRLDLLKVSWPEPENLSPQSQTVTTPILPNDRSDRILESQPTSGKDQSLGDDWSSAITEVGRPSSASVVEIFGRHQCLALGTVVSADGLIVTKHSLLEPTVEVQLFDQQRVKADLIRFDSATDLALLKLRGDSWNLSPIDLSLPAVQTFPSQGKLMLSIPPVNQSIQLGMVITSDHQLNVPASDSIGKFIWGVDFLPTIDQQFFQAENRSGYHRGLRVTRVKPRFLGESCNLLQGDLITAVNSHVMESVKNFEDLTNTLTTGQPIELTIVRGQRSMQLNSVAQSNWTRSEYDLWGGGAFSNRRFGLGTVIIHDIPISPNQQGGLLIDIDGNLIGINLARSLRTATIAMPYARLVEFMKME